VLLQSELREVARYASVLQLAEHGKDTRSASAVHRLEAPVTRMTF
jgi:hypothetical protein